MNKLISSSYWIGVAIFVTAYSLGFITNLIVLPKKDPIPIPKAVWEEICIRGIKYIKTAEGGITPKIEREEGKMVTGPVCRVSY